MTFLFTKYRDYITGHKVGTFFGSFIVPLFFVPVIALMIMLPICIIPVVVIALPLSGNATALLLTLYFALFFVFVGLRLVLEIHRSFNRR